MTDKTDSELQHAIADWWVANGYKITTTNYAALSKSLAERLLPLKDRWEKEAAVRELERLDFDVPRNKHYPYPPGKAKLIAYEIHDRLRQLKGNTDE